MNNAVRLDIVKSEDLSTMRAASNACFNNGITSNIVITHAFTGLLRKSEHPRVIMVSSIRGSLARTANKEVSVIKRSFSNGDGRRLTLICPHIAPASRSCRLLRRQSSVEYAHCAFAERRRFGSR